MPGIKTIPDFISLTIDFQLQAIHKIETEDGLSVFFRATQFAIKSKEKHRPLKIKHKASRHRVGRQIRKAG